MNITNTKCLHNNKSVIAEYDNKIHQLDTCIIAFISNFVHNTLSCHLANNHRHLGGQVQNININTFLYHNKTALSEIDKHKNAFWFFFCT